MGIIHISSFLSYCFLALCLLCSLEKAFALQRKDLKESHSSQHTHTVQLSSLLPSSICSPSSSVAKDKGASLKVIHKYGPCSQLHRDDGDHTKSIVRQDQARVDWINSRLFKKSVPAATAASNGTRYEQDATTLPAKPGEVLGTGNYIVTVGLGTPKEDLSLAFDTGSDLTWTQCQPCAKSCYDQSEAIFDPSKSTSYSNVSCASTDCSQLKSYPGCIEETSTCTYGVRYGDGSYTEGYFSKDRLTLTQSDVIDNFLFGCGQNNGGLFRGSAGLFGLGRNEVSIVEQAADKYNRLFSYCLPSTTSSTGYLTFGDSGGGGGGSVQYTPLLTLSRSASFYALNLLGISVGGRQLEIPSTAFQSGTIIDSGTVISRLPAAVYSSLRSEFRTEMSGYPLVSAGDELFDTCYDLSGSGRTVEFPKIAFLFAGGVTVDLVPSGIMYELSDSPGTFCLAFAGNNDDRQLTIFGNVQQKTFQVVYDVGGARVGFGPGGCS